MKDKKRITYLSKSLGIGLFALAVLMLAGIVPLCLSGDIWYDEFFTVSFIGQGWGKMLSLAAADVHPPLYYVIVKGAVDMVRLFAPEADIASVCKLMSVLPFGLLLLYAGTGIRRRYGWLCAGLFSFCILSMPQLSSYTTEVRMYGYALLFVTAAFYHMGEIYFGDQRTARRHWPLLVIFGLCAAYTHYFAAVSAGVIYLCLLVLTGMKDGWKPAVKSWLIAAACTVAGYLPWLPFGIAQVTAVKESYWILPLTLSCFGGCVKFVLKPATGFTFLDYGLAVLLFAGLAVLAAGTFWKRFKQNGGGNQERQEWAFAFCGILILALTALFGIAVSFLLRPVFVYRYMIPALGCFWFAFAYFVSRCPGRGGSAVMILAALILLGIGVVNFRAFSGEERWKKLQMEHTLESLSQIPADDYLICNFDHVQAVTGYYMENDSYLWGGNPEKLVREMYPKLKSVSDSAQIREWLESGSGVWFLGSGQIRDDIAAQWEAEGFQVEKAVDSCMLERYWFNIYRVSLP